MITDELREYVGLGDGTVPCKIRAIADRIDAEHEKCINAMWETPKPLLNDESLTEHGWVRLPKDADGVPIRIGDVLDPPVGCDNYVPLQVRRLTYDGYEDEWYFDGEVGGFCGMVGEHMDVAGWTHHHHAPTVEDVLREFALRAIRDSECGMGDLDETCAEYASKLRLAEEVDG